MATALAQQDLTVNVLQSMFEDNTMYCNNCGIPMRYRPALSEETIECWECPHCRETRRLASAFHIFRGR